jgi:hypothetical protein
MKPTTILWPLPLPRLSDPAATQLVTLLQQLLASIELHYAPQLARYQRRQHQLHSPRPPPSPTLFDDQPF